jgi:hypothetical protein
MNLNLMTVSEIRKLAAQFGIAGRSTMKKAELIRELSDPDIADLVELSVTVDEIEETAVVAEPSVYEDPAVRAAIRETIAEQAAYIEEGIEQDEAAEQADAEAGELLDAALGEPVEPIADTGQIAITKYSGHEAIATAAFGTDSIAGHVTRHCGRWELRDGVRKIRAKTLGKVAKQWAKALGFHATVIAIDTMS